MLTKAQAIWNIKRGSYKQKDFLHLFPRQLKHWLLGIATYGHKKRDSAESQPFVNLKSNTMKNTLQSYDIIFILQVFNGKSNLFVTLIKRFSVPIKFILQI